MLKYLFHILKYPLAIIFFVLGMCIVYLTIFIGSLIIIIKGVFWDFKFSVKLDRDDDTPLTIKEMWVNSSGIPNGTWEDIKKSLKL